MDSATYSSTGDPSNLLTVPVVKTQASDDTEIWNYVNSANYGQCSGGGHIYSRTVDYPTYSKFSTAFSDSRHATTFFHPRRKGNEIHADRDRSSTVYNGAYNRDLVGNRTYGESMAASASSQRRLVRLRTGMQPNPTLSPSCARSCAARLAPR